MNKLQTYKTQTNSGKMNVTALYSNRFNWKIVVPTMVYHYLIEKTNEQVPFKSFKLEKALYFLSLIISIPQTKKDRIFVGGFVPIYSKLLEKISYDYKKYYDYFIEIGILTVRNHNSTTHKSKSYRYNFKNINSESEDCIDLMLLEIDARISNKIIKYKKIENAINTCGHLCKWFNNGLKINYDALTETFRNDFCYNRYKVGYNNYDKIRAKALNYNYSALMLKEQSYRYSRDKEADNRLHTNLTNMPSKFRPFVTYEGEIIKSLDIKNSQPYFLIYLIENIEDENILRLIKKIYGYRSIMFEKMLETVADRTFQEEFSHIKQCVLNGMFYELLMDIYTDIKPNKDKLYVWKFFNFDNQIKEEKIFEDKRSLIKVLSLQILYTPLVNPSSEYKIFKQNFPMLCKFIEILKTATDDKYSYKLFPKLLQHIESDFVLDKITKKISRDFPDMPIFTIHDSFCTTETWFSLLEVNVVKEFTALSKGMIPKLKTETWSNIDSNSRKAA